ncbi:MAG: Na(+)/H(+) antiporter subunit A [candidate division WS2 bacterium]|nr:Na(+)/H(+) antiporter subunit A [Candidatus Lithacetigena glycinireducens]
MTTQLYILIFFMIIAAIAAIEIKDLLSSVVALGVVGLGVSLAFLLLQAPDLTIVQLVVEILCLVILIRATIKKDIPTRIGDLREVFSGVAVLIFIGVFLFYAYGVIKEMSVFGSPLMTVSKYYIENALQETGAANIVSAIILNYRALDTLGEATVLFTAVISVLAVMRHVGRKDRK